jgi:hypothetical protein
MQGTETTLGGPASSRARVARAARVRFAWIAACALVTAPVVLLGARRMGAFGAVASSDSVEGAIEDARDCMRHRAWDAPTGRNFKDITDAALARWPMSKALTDLRSEAAELVVHDALARKYANDPVEAARLVALALSFDPQLTTAQHLAAELASAQAPEIAPAPSSAASVDHVKSSHRPRDARDARDARGDAKPDPRAPTPRPPASGAPATAPLGPVTAGAVLPPPPVPRPRSDAPAPSSTGPWL